MKSTVQIRADGETIELRIEADDGIHVWWLSIEVAYELGELLVKKAGEAAINVVRKRSQEEDAP